MRRRPALMGGKPAFDSTIDVVRTAIPSLDILLPKIVNMMENRRLSNHGEFVHEFERMVCEALDVRNCVATCNGTLSLVLALKGMGLQGKVVVPSFASCATVHAVVRAGLEPVFADIDPVTLNITPQTVEAVMTPDVAAIMPVTVFGNPCDVDGFSNLAELHGVRLVFDSAQGMGSEYGGRRLGCFGDVESFSVHPTKILPAGEGGFLTTDDDDLAEHMKRARNAGIKGDSGCLMPGVNAKMGEFPAILAIEGLKRLAVAIENRAELVKRYRELLGEVPGIRFQGILPGTRTNHQYFVIMLDEEFGMSRDVLAIALLAENIGTRKYFSPPAHATTAYSGVGVCGMGNLECTSSVSRQVLSLPLHTEMNASEVDRICEVIALIQREAAEILSSETGGRAGGIPRISF